MQHFGPRRHRFQTPLAPVVCFALVFAPGSMGQAAASVPATAPAAQSQPRPADSPVLPTSSPHTAGIDRLEPIALPGLGDAASEADLAAFLERRAEELTSAAERTDGAEAAEARLAAAAYLLVRQIEPALSRELLDIGRPADRRRIAGGAKRALCLVEQAVASTETAPLDDDRSRRAETIQAYARLFAALSRNPSAADRKDAMVDACRGLATFIDEAPAAVSSSARLWQAAAYRRAGRIDRVLQVLPLATAPPRVWPYDFFARLERCRALADRGDWAAAVALTLRIESRLGDWLAPSQLDAARYAIVFLRRQLWLRWSQRLRSDGHVDQADAAAAEAEALAQTLAGMPSGAARLGEAVGGLEAPLLPPRVPARFLDIVCDAATVVVVLDGAVSKPAAWDAALRATREFLERLNPDQSFALIVAGPDGPRSFPSSPFATAPPEQRGAAASFLDDSTLRSPVTGTQMVPDLSAALLRAVALKPGALVLLTARSIAHDVAQDLPRLAADAHLRLHVVWLAAEEDRAAAAQKLAHDCGGEFHILGQNAAATTGPNRDKADTRQADRPAAAPPTAPTPPGD